MESLYRELGVCSVSTNASNQRWNLNNMEIQTLSAEKTLEPLAEQITILANTKEFSNKKKGKSRNPKVLVRAVENSVVAFVVKGTEIAEENMELRDEFLQAVENITKDGKAMSNTAHQFVNDPFSSKKRGEMIRAARCLLKSVTRLVILADMIDVINLLKRLRVTQQSMAHVIKARNQGELLNNFGEFGRNLIELNRAVARRQNDLKNGRRKEDLASARGQIQKNCTMVYSTSQAYLNHPEVAAIRDNRDYAFSRIEDALSRISDVVQATGELDSTTAQQGGQLTTAFDEYLDNIDIVWCIDFDESRCRVTLEERLESIIGGAASLADSCCTTDESTDKIVAKCNAVRQALQDMLQQYITNAGKDDKSEDFEEAVDRMVLKTEELRCQLREAIIDHASELINSGNGRLIALIEAAKSGDEIKTKANAQMFHEHASKLVEVAIMACSMSTNEEGVKTVRLAARHLDTMRPQVINAALSLAARPKSMVMRDNMEAFKNAWQTQVRVLTESVDAITCIDDFLAVLENHILEDVSSCVIAFQDSDFEVLERNGNSVESRCARVCQVVSAEMSNYEQENNTIQALEACKALQIQVMPSFRAVLERSLKTRKKQQPEDPNENEFIEACRSVYDGVHEIRRAFLSVTVSLGDASPVVSSCSGNGNNVETEGNRDRDNIRIKEQVKEFDDEKRLLDFEVNKWDDSSNDIVVLAKKMCMIMMEMTDFTRGRGNLRTAADVITAAQRIADDGSRLDELGRSIAEVCPDSVAKKDLLAYLQRITLCCHQLKMCSRVKADIPIGGDVELSDLDSATSLIAAAKNLMNAVVLTVKASYVASTKFKKSGQSDPPIVMWKMKAPEKKPLVRSEKLVRRQSQKKINPVKLLSQFRADI